MSPSGGGMSDLSMFDLFCLEVETQAAALSQHLLELEEDVSSPRHLEALMRASHSLKGAARMVGVDPVVDITHVMEDCFVSAQKNQLVLNRNHIDVLLKAVDVITSIAKVKEDRLAEYYLANEQEVQSLVLDLEKILSGEALNETSDPNVTHKPNQTKTICDEVSTSHPPQEAQENTVEQGDERTLRVSADRVSRILGMSSELLVESRGLAKFTSALYLIKRRQDELMGALEHWRDAENNNDLNKLDYQKSALQGLDECRRLLSDQLSLLDEYDRRNGNLTNKLYNEVAGSRMRPFSYAVSGFKRMVRDLSRSLNKEAALKFQGLNTPVDRDVLEKIKAPLNHLLRNSLDHGIEPVPLRAERGKPKTASIIISAAHGGGMLRVTVEDDGGGVDLDQLKSKLISKGLVAADMMASLSEEELLEFLFLPDFSTRDAVTELSGRGVGLDVVRDMVRELGGSVSVENQYGGGAKFTLLLPLTLSVISALLVDIADEPYAFPLSRVDRILRVPFDSIEVVEGRQYVNIDNLNIGLVSGAQVLGFDVPKLEREEFTIVVISDRLDTYGVVVDRFIGQRQLSVQPLDQRLGKIPDVSAAALTEDGSPVFILDVEDMVRSIDHIVSGGRVGNVFQHAEKLIQSARKRVLVVDDSLTVREVERDVLQGHGYHVEVAVDGMDGWNAVRSSHYDLIITDVDMPRMDGIELVKAIKHDLHLKQIPIMIVSYKDRAEDRRRGLDAGADYYLTKGSFQDNSLIEAVTDLIGEAQA
jgi:two-component system sensor histidine kinase and response regulator WspE